MLQLEGGIKISVEKKKEFGYLPFFLQLVATTLPKLMPRGLQLVFKFKFD